MITQQHFEEQLNHYIVQDISSSLRLQLSINDFCVEQHNKNHRHHDEENNIIGDVSVLSSTVQKELKT
jgi:hypothetical protein